MDARRFDTLARLLTRTGSRRRALLAALGGALGTTPGAFSVDEAAAKKKCPPCTKRNKQGKCKKKKPDGITCKNGGTCQGGRCVAAAPPCRGLDTPCTADAQCCSGICDSYFDECQAVRFGCDPIIAGQCPDQGICCTIPSSGDEFVCIDNPLTNRRACGGTSCGDARENCANFGTAAQCQNGQCCCLDGETCGGGLLTCDP